MDVVLLFPGQGSQKPGMGRDVADAFAEARHVFEDVDAALGEPLSALCFDGPAEELTLTHNAQPALLAHGAALWAVARPRLAGRVVAAAGHSLGEFTAYVAADAISVPDGARLVRRRGALMLASGRKRPGTMAAILGDTDEPIARLCEQATAEAGLVVPANYNAPGQVVVSGETAGVERAMALARAHGARRAVPLNVSGAFHSPLMEDARDGLTDALRALTFASPRVPVYANVNAEPVADAAVARDLLRAQLTAPVRWTEVVTRLASDFPRALFVELGPGAVLTGLVKKTAPQVETFPCGTAADLERLFARVAA